MVTIRKRGGKCVAPVTVVVGNNRSQRLHRIKAIHNGNGGTCFGTAIERRHAVVGELPADQ